MKLGPQNAQEPNKKANAETGKEQNGGKQTRKRRVAPRYTLVWAEEVQTLQDISSEQIRELHRAAIARMELAEAARNNDPSIAKIGAAAEIDDIVWSKFNVGKHWFILEFRPADIREYIVNLATPPSPEDIPPPPDCGDCGRGEDTGGDDDAAPPSAGDQRQGNGSDSGSGAESALSAAINLCVRRDVTAVRRLMRNLIRHARTIAEAYVSHQMREFYRNVAYKTRVLGASIQNFLRRCASTIAARHTSFTRMRELPAQRVSFEAHLEPGYVGLSSGMRVLLYSWIRDEPPVDWSADLFGVLPTDWAANLFGVLPEENRAVT